MQDGLYEHVMITTQLCGASLRASVTSRMILVQQFATCWVWQAIGMQDGLYELVTITTPLCGASLRASVTSRMI
jgi:hypothetical protein